MAAVDAQKRIYHNPQNAGRYWIYCMAAKTSQTVKRAKRQPPKCCRVPSWRTSLHITQACAAILSAQ